jgi:hypothetical protein
MIDNIYIQKVILVHLMIKYKLCYVIYNNIQKCILNYNSTFYFNFH